MSQADMVPRGGAGSRPAGASVHGRLGWGRALSTVVRMELRQRLRSRTWYIVLAAWFVVIGLVTWGAFASFYVLSAEGQMGLGVGRFVFEAVAGFVLFFGLLVAPVLSASTISGDRAGGTLAVMQVTLLTPCQLLAGKWFASWIAALAFLATALPYIVVAMFMGGLDAAGLTVFVVMVAIELGLVWAIGTAVSAVAVRTLFSVVVTYLLVVLFFLGTLISFGLTMPLPQTTVPANIPKWNATGEGDSASAGPDVCFGQLNPEARYDTRATYWMLAAIPFVVVSDAVPTPARVPMAPRIHRPGGHPGRPPAAGRPGDLSGPHSAPDPACRRSAYRQSTAVSGCRSVLRRGLHAGTSACARGRVR